MNQLLKIGSTLQAETTPCRVERFLGGGGQGEVYRVEIEDKALALKWYFPQTATSEQQQMLQTLINRGAPDARFLWPMAMLTANDVPGIRLSDAATRSALPQHRRSDEAAGRAQFPGAGDGRFSACRQLPPVARQRDVLSRHPPSGMCSAIPIAVRRRSAITTTSASMAMQPGACWAHRALWPLRWCGAMPYRARKPTCTRWRCCCSICLWSITPWRVRKRAPFAVSISRQ